MEQADNLGPLFKLDTSGFKFAKARTDSGTEEKVQCPLDGEWFVRLGNHFKAEHPDKYVRGYSSEDYIERYG